MADQPEYIFSNPAGNGPIFTVMSADELTSASLSIGTDGLITFVGTIPNAMMKMSATASRAASASIAESVPFSGISNTPSLVSSSAQISYTAITNIPSGIISSSVQVNSNLPSGTVSSSAQVLNGSGVVSSSAQFNGSSIFNVAQVTSSFSGTLTGTASWASAATTASFVSTAQTASYIGWTNVANKPAGLVSSSAQVLVGSTIWSSSAQLPSGIISSSAQVTMSNAISASYSVTSSYASVAQTLLGSVTSASYAATASVALVALTSSYVNSRTVQSFGQAEAVKTTTQTVTIANTFQQIPFDVNGTTNSTDWTYSNGATTFTCNTPATYSIDCTVYLQKTGGTATVGGIRLVKNGTEIQGSYNAFTFASNNTIQSVAVAVVEPFTTSNTLNVQIIGGATTIQAAQVPAVGGPTTRPSAVLRIHSV